MAVMLAAAAAVMSVVPTHAYAQTYSPSVSPAIREVFAMAGTAETEQALAVNMRYRYEYAGEFRVTAYCGCRSCNGRWTGYPARNGEPLERGVTIAVDPDVIPLGSYVIIEGVGVRKAQDTGSKIIGNTIDLYFDTHGQTGEWGVRQRKVWVIPAEVVEALDRVYENNYVAYANTASAGGAQGSATG